MCLSVITTHAISSSVWWIVFIFTGHRSECCILKERWSCNVKNWVIRYVCSVSYRIVWRGEEVCGHCHSVVHKYETIQIFKFSEGGEGCGGIPWPPPSVWNPSMYTECLCCCVTCMWLWWCCLIPVQVGDYYSRCYWHGTGPASVHIWKRVSVCEVADVYTVLCRLLT